MKKTWIFLSNTFAVQTRTSHKKMLSLATDTDAKLSNEVADPAINTIYLQFHPVYDAYRMVCINFDMAEGNYEGQTLAFEDILDSIPQHIRVWESQIRYVYVEDTPEEHALFPNKRTPFISGTYEDRLSTIGTLAEALSSIPALSATHALVASFYNTALSTRLAQQQKEGNVGLLSDLREQQRLLVATELYGVLGSLMFKFRASPTDIERFFDLELLRGKSPEQPSGPVTISGRVTAAGTSDGIAGARVVLSNAQGSIEVFTDSNGNYVIEIPELDESAEGELEVSASAYQTHTETIVIEPGSDLEIDVELNPGA